MAELHTKTNVPTQSNRVSVSQLQIGLSPEERAKLLEQRTVDSHERGYRFGSLNPIRPNTHFYEVESIQGKRTLGITRTEEGGYKISVSAPLSAIPTLNSFLARQSAGEILMEATVYSVSRDGSVTQVSRGAYSSVPNNDQRKELDGDLKKLRPN